MTLARAAAAPIRVKRQMLRPVLWLLIFLTAISGFFLSPEIKVYPTALTLPFDDWVRAVVAWLTSDVPQIPGLPPIITGTRAVARVFDVALGLFQGALSDGFSLSNAGTPAVPPLPWFLIIGLMVGSGYKLGGRSLALVTLIGLAFIAITGNWASAMTTFAFVIVVAGLVVAAGLLIGILAFKSSIVDRCLSPVLDLMQTVPVFAYLVPVLLIVGFGSAAAMVATFVYAVPPMIRNVILGLRRVPKSCVEFGEIAGCTPFQLITKVTIPLALPSIMVGLNQAVMMTLNMVIIASMIGAGGLGFEVLTALRRLDIAGGLEAGLAIVALAVILDRQSQALATRSNEFQHTDTRSALARRWIYLLGALACAFICLLAYQRPEIAYFPQAFIFTAKGALNVGARWVTYNLSDSLDRIKTWFLIFVMVPLRTYTTGLPWFALPIAGAIAGALLGGSRLALLCFLLLLAIFVAGLQEPALMTVYLCGLGTFISLLIGIPLGVLGARHDRWHRALGTICDTLQTMPSFVYLIPVVMMFRVGDFSALVAIVAYAVVPAIRYTDFGIRKVQAELVEASIMNGCSRLQTLLHVELPLATPEVILGISQTVIMALSMLVITALVGTRDLGQETYIALVKADAGRGLVAGFAVSILAMVSDRLLTAWSRRRFQKLGLS